MSVIENVTSLKASPLRVWSVLTDFAGHARWKPFIQLSGAAVQGGEAAYIFRIGKLDKEITAKADIICIDKPRMFAWTAGVPKLLLFEENYTLETEATGTRMRHSLHLSGLVGTPMAAIMRHKFHASLVRSDASLERHLRRRAAHPSAKGRTLPPRNGFRSNRRPS
ncbi:SRPBCC family protein [Sphingobium sufflavum]|nr:SRPBCC family protein [Sphingobium sufflavum]